VTETRTLGLPAAMASGGNVASCIGVRVTRTLDAWAPPKRLRPYGTGYTSKRELCVCTPETLGQ
jgi:hypothetical protein